MRWLALKLIRLYQRFISPLFPPCCKYYPSCSAYAVGVFQRFGFLRGFILAGWRILRCNPLSNGGVDYVPEHFFDAFKRKKRHPHNCIEHSPQE